MDQTLNPFQLDSFLQVLQTFAAILPMIIIVFSVALISGFIQKIFSKSGKKNRQKVKAKRHEKNLKKLDKIYGTFTLTKIDKMSGKRFEEFVEKMFRVLYNDQWLKTEPTKASGDQGCDIVVDFKDGTRLGIQCKRYIKKTDNKAVQEIIAATKWYGLTRLMVVTSSHFTPSAKELARTYRVELVDREKLGEMIDKYNEIISNLHSR